MPSIPISILVVFSAVYAHRPAEIPASIIIYLRPDRHDVYPTRDGYTRENASPCSHRPRVTPPRYRPTSLESPDVLRSLLPTASLSFDVDERKVFMVNQVQFETIERKRDTDIRKVRNEHADSLFLRCAKSHGTSVSFIFIVSL